MGESYIKMQLESLVNQVNASFKVFVRDDGSTDGSAQLIDIFKKGHPNIFRIVEDHLGNLGSTNSFLALLSYSDADYFMFCDQDDVWHSDKVSKSIKEIKKLEAIHSPWVPCAVFTDLTVVDGNLEVVAESFWRHQRLEPSIALNWKDLIAQNVVTGCTLIINRAAKEVCLPFPDIKMIHDQWIAVNVAKYGVITWILEPTMLYRQHGSNVAGAKKIGPRYIFQKMRNIKDMITFYRAMSAHFDGEVTIINLLYRKLKISMKRFLWFR